MRKIVLFFFGIIVSCIAFSQTNTHLDETWNLDTTVNGVACYYKIIKCDDVDCVVLAFNNQNAAPVAISWQEKFVIDSTVMNGPMSIKTAILPPGITLQNSCTITGMPILFISINDFGSGHSSINSFDFITVQVIQ